MNASNFTLLIENQDFLAIDKPAGISFHSEREQSGLVVQLGNQLKIPLWPVHRLDKMTSGVLLLAKSKEAAVELNSQFAKHAIKKTYIALSDSKPKKKQGTIKGDMKKSRNGNWKLCHSLDNPATTRFNSCALVPGIRFFWVQPETGKTHQIRVALKSLGSPVLGDERYQGKRSDRGYLHAYRLEFNWQGQSIDIQQPPCFGEQFMRPELAECIARFCNAPVMAEA